MLEVGQHVGRYRILRKLGEGGMGAVYEGVHEQIARHAAIKVLLPQFARDKGVAQRFLNEARAVNLIGHPGIVEIYDLGQLPDGSGFIVMEMLTGETLSTRLERRGGRLALAEALHILRQLAAALLAAHEKGIVHRDIKPDNVMLVRDSSQPSGERTKLLDFGIAKLAHEGDPCERTAARLTQTGAVMGTALYMAPEQCTGAGRIDSRADVYALGAMLFHALAGRPPFVADGVGAIMAMHIYAEPPTLLDVGAPVPPEVSELAARMLAKDPAQRPGAEEILSQTQSLSESFPFVRSALRSDGDGLAFPVSPRSGPSGSRLTGGRTGRRGSARKTGLVLGLLLCGLGIGGGYYGLGYRPAAKALAVAARGEPPAPAERGKERPAPASDPAPAAVSVPAAPAPAASEKANGNGSANVDGSANGSASINRATAKREQNKPRPPVRVSPHPQRNRPPRAPSAASAAPQKAEPEIEATPRF